MSSYSIYDDSKLIMLLKGNDGAAYTTLFDRYQPLLYIYACKITKQEDEAADIVQEVFLNLWEKRADTHFTGPVLSYLYQAVRFRFFNLLDKRKVRQDYALSMKKFMDEGQPVTDHDVREREMMMILEKQIELLPPKLKQVYQLSRRENMSNAQIANHLGVSEKTINNQLSIAVKQLKTKMGLTHTGILFIGTELLNEILKKI